MTSTQADLLIADARRAAAEIGRWGWRPKDFDFQRLRGSTKHAPSYLILSRAWKAFLCFSVFFYPRRG